MRQANKCLASPHYRAASQPHDSYAETYCWSSSESPRSCSGVSPGTSSGTDFTFAPLLLFFRMPFIGRGAAIPTRWLSDRPASWLNYFLQFIFCFFDFCDSITKDRFSFKYAPRHNSILSHKLQRNLGGIRLALVAQHVSGYSLTGGATALLAVSKHREISETRFHNCLTAAFQYSEISKLLLIHSQICP